MNQEERKLIVGGSEIAAVMGLSRYRCARDVYEKKANGVQDPKNFHMDRGTFLEPAIRKWWAADTGKVCVKPTESYRNPFHQYLTASVDGLVKHKKQQRHPYAIWECKCPMSGGRWGESGTNDIDPEYFPQVQVYMGVYDVPLAIVVAFFNGEIHEYQVAFDADFFRDACFMASVFITQHVAKGIPPPWPDVPVEGTVSAVAKAYPMNSTGLVLRATAPVEQAIKEYLNINEHMKEVESKKETLKAFIESNIGDADGIEGGTGRATWKNNKPSVKVDWKQVAQDAKVCKSIIDLNTTTYPGPRVFRVTGAK